MRRHHTYEDRLAIVSRLLSGETLYKICKEFKLDRKMVQNWLLRYQKYGDAGLQNLPQSRYRAADKLTVVLEFVEKEVSLQQLCLRYNLGRATIKRWARRYRAGMPLEDRKMRQTYKDPMARPKKKEPQTELEKLQAENLRLRAENALLKKVKALVEEKEARARVIGQKPSMN